jgi:signal transduction histidine kinase
LSKAPLAEGKQPVMAELTIKMRAEQPAMAEWQDQAVFTAEGWQNSAAIARLLRMVASLWISYFLLTGLLDQLFVAFQPTFHALPLRYYLLQISIACSVLGISWWSTLWERWGRLFLPLVIAWMVMLPPLLGRLLIPTPPPRLIVTTEGFDLRLIPVLLLALLIVAWHYDWQQVVLFNLGTAVLTLIQLIPSGLPLRPPPAPALMIILVQTIICLLIGYCICTLIGRLRTQRASLEQANLQLRHYASTLEHLTLSRERNRVARELHDTLAHSLSGLTVQLETAKAYWEVDPLTARARIETALETARSGLDETRRALKALRASPLDDLGLSLALQTMVVSAAERADLRVTLSVAAPEALPVLTPDVEQGIYRIAQEALANVIHHAGAKQLEVQLSACNDQVTLMVRDDGRGFALTQAEQPGHFGLAGMRERAHLIGGTLTITSQPGAGTAVRLTIPW